MKNSPLACTSTGPSFEASSAMGDAVNFDITDVTFSVTSTATAVTSSTTDVETQTNPVKISQVRHFTNAAVVTDDIIIAPMKVDHDYPYVKPTLMRKRRNLSFARKTDVTFLHLPHIKLPKTVAHVVLMSDLLVIFSQGGKCAISNPGWVKIELSLLGIHVLSVRIGSIGTDYLRACTISQNK